MFAQLKTEWKTTKRRIFRPQIMLSSYVWKLRLFFSCWKSYFLGYKLDWTKMVMSHVVLQQLMRCFKWCISILYVPSVHKEYCFRWTTSWKQLSLMNIGYSKCVIITYCDYIMKSIPSNLPLLREFFLSSPIVTYKSSCHYFHFWCLYMCYVLFIKCTS